MKYTIQSNDNEHKILIQNEDYTLVNPLRELLADDVEFVGTHIIHPLDNTIELIVVTDKPIIELLREKCKIISTEYSNLLSQLEKY